MDRFVMRAEDEKLQDLNVFMVRLAQVVFTYFSSEFELSDVQRIM